VVSSPVEEYRVQILVASIKLPCWQPKKIVAGRRLVVFVVGLGPPTRG